MLDPQLATAMVGTAAAAVLMVFAGVQKSALEWRNHRRRCPSCGRHIRNRTCACCAR